MGHVFYEVTLLNVRLEDSLLSLMGSEFILFCVIESMN